MKRKSRFLALAGVALLGTAACQVEPQLAGTLPLGDNIEVYLINMSNDTPERVDTARIMDKRFAFTGTYGPGVYEVEVSGMARYTVELEPNKHATIEVKDSIGNPATVTCKGGEMLTEIERIEAELANQARPLVQQYKELLAKPKSPDVLAELDRIEQMHDSITTIADKQRLDLLYSMPKGITQAYLLRRQLPAMGNEQKAQLEMWVKTLDLTQANNAHIKAIQKHFDTEARLQPGNPFIDFQANDIDGKPVRLSDYVGKGKVVLLEMWASWCPYCRQANPGLREVYKMYNAKGYQVFGLSFDRDLDAWKKAIDEDTLPWPNFVVNTAKDAKADQESHPGELYNVRGIPFNILFDRDGIIVARNVDTDSLKAHLNSLLAK